MMAKLYQDINKKLKNIIATPGLSVRLKSELKALNKKIEKLSKREKIFYNLVNIDGLTELYNRRYFRESLAKEISRASRFKHPLSLVMIDIDHFKKFNDTYGHPQGDIVLKEIARLLRSRLRSYDTASRYGGEEFALFLPYTGKQSSYLLMERIRREISNYPFYGTRKGRKEKVKITISVGLAVYPANAITKSELINRADKALYIAKEEGRNRVCSSLVTGKEFVRFAFCPPTLSPFYSNVLRGVREVMEEVGNVNLLVMAGRSESSYKEQLRLMEKAIKDRADAIGICSKIDVGDIVVKANKSGSKVFVFNIRRLKMKSPGKVTSYIGYEQAEAGRKVGRFLVRLLRDEGLVAVLEGIPDEIDSIEREKGFVEILKEHPSIKIVASQPTYWDRNKARTVAKRILKKYPKLDAFFGLSDEMALGALDAIKDAGKMGKIFVIGLDGNQNAFQSIKKGELFATLNTNPVGMGRILARTILRSEIKEEVIAKKIESPIMIVDSENVDLYLE